MPYFITAAVITKHGVAWFSPDKVFRRIDANIMETTTRHFFKWLGIKIRVAVYLYVSAGTGPNIIKETVFHAVDGLQVEA